MNIIGNMKFDFNVQDEPFARDLNAHWESFFMKHLESIADEVLTQYDIPGEVLEIDRLDLDLRILHESDFDRQFLSAFREQLENELIKHIYYKRNITRKPVSASGSDVAFASTSTSDAALASISAFASASGFVSGSASPENAEAAVRHAAIVNDYAASKEVVAINDAAALGLSTAKVSSVAQYAFSILCHFLLYGTLPSTAESRYRNIQALLLEALRENSAELKRFLFTYGHYTSLQERLVYQFSDPLLEDTVRLLEPESGEFIVSYVYLLRARYKDVAQPGIHETGYRHSVWFVVYAYLLHNTGSWFSRRNFVRQTIIRLGAKYNIAYEQLLDLITRELEQFAQSVVIDPELFEILKYLRRQSDEKRIQQSAVSGAKFYKELFVVLQQDINKGVTAENRLYILQILSRPDLCRLFLQQLNETEITGLVPVVLPADSHFVIATAHSLDLQKDRGGLQGKAGNEYRLIKWQVIFSLLLHEKKVSFNRHYFVAATLREIAAHYNLDWRELVDFFLSDPLLREKINKELLFVLQDLQKESAGKQNNRVAFAIESSENLSGTNTPLPHITQIPQASDDSALPPHTPPSPDDNAILSHIRQMLKQDKAFSPAEQRYLLQKTGDYRFRRILLDKTTEAEQIQLIQILFPENKEHIISYIQKLDLLRDFNQIAGKTPGGFTRIKWDFLFAVLSGIEDKSFNRLDFISRTLQQIAAHYNTTKLDLLYYFRQEEINAQIPYPLKKWLDELYTQEITLRLKTTLPADIAAESGNSVPVFTVSLEEPSAIILSEAKTDWEKELAGKLLLQKDFIQYTGSLFRLIPSIRRFFTDELKKELSEESLYKFLFDLSLVYKTLSVKDMLSRFVEWLQKSIPAEKQAVFYANAERWSDQHVILHSVLYKNNDYLKEKHMNTPQTIEIMETNQSVHINNAGIVLTTPFLQVLFRRLELLGEDRKFKNKEAQIKAIYLAQYAAFDNTDFPEHELVLNKILVGLDVNEAIPFGIELSEQDKKTCREMLESIKKLWDKMRGTSIEGLQQAFLQRPGNLGEKEDHYQLTVEEKAYDILLDSLPWNFRIIKYPWMPQMINVKWRG